MLLLFIGCATVAGERATSVVELAGEVSPVPVARLWLSETTVVGADGMRSLSVLAMASEVADLVNQAFVAELRERNHGLGPARLAVPAETQFGKPVTLPPSDYLDGEALRISVWASAPPGAEWVVVVRHRVEFNVFNDSLELQLRSVATLLDPGGRAAWQAAVRSRKLYDGWFGGEQLAALTAHYVSDTVKENAASLARLSVTPPRSKAGKPVSARREPGSP